MSQRQRKLAGNIEVLKRNLAVIKLIGKQGIAYRAHRNEALRTLQDKTVNHGNFLEMISLLADFDSTLSNHLEKAMRESSNRQENLAKLGRATSRGRGNLITKYREYDFGLYIQADSFNNSRRDWESEIFIANGW